MIVAHGGIPRCEELGFDPQVLGLAARAWNVHYVQSAMRLRVSLRLGRQRYSESFSLSLEDRAGIHPA